MLRRQLILSAIATCASVRSATAQTVDFESGQTWTLKPPSTPGARIRIGRIEDDRATLHISLWGVPAPNEITHIVGPTLVAGHLPIAAEALRASVDRLVDDDAPADLNFEQGYRAWREANGGVFTITVPEIVDVLVQSIRGDQGAPAK